MGEVKTKKSIICVPGQRLCLANENTVAGTGTYERHGYIYSMLAGVVLVTEKDKVNCNSNEYLIHSIINV